MENGNGGSGRFRLSAEQGFDLALVVAGFGLCRAWIVSCLAAPVVNSQPLGVNWLYLTMGALAALFIAFAARKLAVNSERFHEHVSETTLSLLLASAILIPASFVLDSASLTLAGFMVGGVGAGVLQVLWGERFAVRGNRLATMASAGAAIATAVLLALLPSDVRPVGYAVLPLMSFLLLVAECRRGRVSWRTGLSLDDPDLPAVCPLCAAPVQGDRDEGRASAGAEDAGNAEGAQGDEHRRLVRKLMVSVAIFSFLVRMFDALPDRGIDPFGAVGGSSLFALVIVGAVFIGMAFLPKERFNVTLVYRVSVPIMVLGFTSLVLFFEHNSAIAILLIGVGYEFFDILAWILFADLARRGGAGTGYVFGLGVASMFLGMAAGLLAGDLVHTLVADGTLQVTVVGMASILSLVFTGFMLFPEGVLAQLSPARSTKARKEADVRDAAAPAGAVRGETPVSMEDRCAAVAKERGLTARESEILVLLARGRTISIIARDLQIAKGTARTHAERIYRKLDVHKQQELIDMVEAAQPLATEKAPAN